MRILFLFLLFMTGTVIAVGQTRTNTKALGEKLHETAERKREEAANLRAKAEAAQAAVEAAKERMAEIDQEIDHLTKVQEETRQKKARLLGEVVFDIMNDPSIGRFAREKPQRVRLIPAIKEVLRNNPWLDPVLDDILKEYK